MSSPKRIAVSIAADPLDTGPASRRCRPGWPGPAKPVAAPGLWHPEGDLCEHGVAHGQTTFDLAVENTRTLSEAAERAGVGG